MIKGWIITEWFTERTKLIWHSTANSLHAVLWICAEKEGHPKMHVSSPVWKLSYIVLSSLYLWSVLKNLLSVFYINSRFDPRLIYGVKKLLFKGCHDQEVSVQKAQSSQSTLTWFFECFHSDYLSGLHAFCIYSFQHLGTNPQIKDGFWMNWCLFICSLKKNTFSNKICFRPKFKYKSQRAASDNNSHQKLMTKSHICVAA